MTPKQQRQARLRQALHRGSRRSYKTELKNALLLLAWESTGLSEEQISQLLNVDRLEVHEMRLKAIECGMMLAKQIKGSSK